MRPKGNASQRSGSNDADQLAPIGVCANAREHDFSRYRRSVGDANRFRGVIPAIARNRLSMSALALLTGLYEKVINVKADVAAVLVSATKRREW